MRFAMRLKVISVCAVFVLLLAGYAWGDESSVIQAVTDYNNNYSTSLTAVNSGSSTVTIGGSAYNVNNTLDLGDISDLTIDWRATLSGKAPNINSNSYLIQFSGNGDFNITAGKITMESRDYWMRAIVATEDANITLSGGEIEGLGAQDTGIDIPNGTLTVAGGKLTIPNGNGAFAKTININDSSGINGVICKGYGVTTGLELSAYGTVTTTEESEIFYGEEFSDVSNINSFTYIVEEGAKWYLKEITSDSSQEEDFTVSIKVKNGGTLNLESTHLKFKGTLTVEQPDGELNLDENSSITLVGGTFTNRGKININGTLTNHDKLINHGTINNYSGKTLDNQGTLTNEGVINNGANGKIKNTGTIDNTNGKIDNTAGGTFESVQTASEMGGDVEGPVELINNNTSSGGGCNTGFGLFGLLLLAAFAVYKKHLTA